MANDHTLEQKEFIVRKLASFETPRAIVIDFAAIFPRAKCDENDVRRLDPTTGAVLAPDLYMLFIQTREAVMLDPKSAPFADQNARLIALSKQVSFYISNNQLAEARTAMRQIAEEKGVLGAKGKVALVDEKDDPIASIVRTIVDPKKVENEQPQQAET